MAWPGADRPIGTDQRSPSLPAPGTRNWRKGWDSNPRYSFPHAGFQDRCLKPLGHPSEDDQTLLARRSCTATCVRRAPYHASLWRRAACRQRRSLSGTMQLLQTGGPGADYSYPRGAGAGEGERPATSRLELSHRKMALQSEGSHPNKKPSPMRSASTRATCPSARQHRVKLRRHRYPILCQRERDQARAQHREARCSQGEKAARDDVLMSHKPPPASDAGPN
jgi:hypothetical protein